MTVAANQREDEENLLKAARSIVEMQALRRQFFPAAMFGEPAWDILLALYLASARADRTVDRLAQHSGAPLSTAIRWLNYLEAEGLVMLDTNVHEPAQRQVHLTDKANRSLRAFLSQNIHCAWPLQA